MRVIILCRSRCCLVIDNLEFCSKIVASEGDSDTGGSHNSPPKKEQSMCLLERREATISPLNMTLAARLYSHNSCVEVGVPVSSWSSVTCCPNCRSELRVSLSAGCGKHAPASPLAPPFLHPACLPAPFYAAPTAPDLHAQQEDQRILTETLRVLRLSGWYYGQLDWQGARSLLKEASVGVFLIRDSVDSNFYFSLSIQTERGPTSVRLHFEQGFFRLDCDRPLARYMPRFRCVMELVQYYTRVGQRGLPGTMWVDREGCPHSPVLLKTPLRKKPPSLLHSARLAIHKTLDSNPLTPKLWCAPKHRLLPLPSSLIDYLGEYPYSI